jgi:hypothetical protein
MTDDGIQKMTEEELVNLLVTKKIKCSDKVQDYLESEVQHEDLKELTHKDWTQILHTFVWC